MKKIVDFLEQLGLTKLEAKLYQEILKIGPTTVKEVAESVGINRVTAHFQIDNLIQKGLITQLKQTTRRQIVAEPPERLHYLIEQKEKNVKQLKEDFPDFLKTLSDNLPKTKTKEEKVEVKYYEGKKGVQLIYNDVLSSKEVRSYVKLDAIASIFPNNFTLFNRKLKENPDLRIWEIVEKSKTSEKHTDNFAKNTRYHYKLAHPSIKLSSSDVMIYNNKIAMVNLVEQVSGVIIISKDFYEMSKEIFDFVWKMTPD